MKYSEFRMEALKAWKELPEEQNEMYKHHYLGLAAEISEMAEKAAGESEEKEALQSLSAQIESLTGVKIDVLVSNNSFISNSRFVRLAEDETELLEFKQHTNMEDKLVSLIHAKSQRNLIFEVPAGEHATISMLVLASHSPLYGQVFIRLGEHSTLSMFELCMSHTNSPLSALLHEASISKHAKAEINIIRNEMAQTTVLNFCKAKVEENAHLKANVLYNGGGKIKSRSIVACVGPTATSEINESILGTEAQKFDLYTYLVNDAPKTICHSETKAVLMGKSYGYVKGFAKINKGAVDSRSYVEERGLILEKGAYINLIPDMSIDENEVKATHSGASAPIDQDSLFYMMSRGTDLPMARRLIINGFFGEILSKMENNDAKRLSLALMHDKSVSGKVGHVPTVDMGELWISEAHGEQSIFGGHYKYR